MHSGDAHTAADALRGEDPAQILDDVQIMVDGGDADTQVVAERADREIQAGRCGEEAHRTHMARESFIQGDSAKVQIGRAHV